MSILKKVTAGLLCAVMLISFSACGEQTSWAAKSGDMTIPAGVYLYYQIQAYYDAASKQTSQTEDILSSTIEDKPAKEWINDTATDYVKRYIAVVNKYNELGLTLSDEDNLQIQNSLSSFIDQSGDLIKQNGISEDSMKLIITESLMQSAIYDYYYAKGGIEEVTDEDVEKCIEEKYARFKFIAIQLKDGEGNLFKSADKEKAMERAEKYVDRAATDGFDALIDEYTDYYTKLVKDATDKDPTDVLSSKGGSNEDYPCEAIASTTGSSPSQKVMDKINSMKPSTTPFIVEEDEIYYVVQKLDITERKDLIADYRDTLVYSLKGEEFEALIKEWQDAVELEKNQAAYDRYDPKNINLNK